MIFRRSRFADVIARQLDVFAEDEAHGLLEEVREAKSVVRPRRARRGGGALRRLRRRRRGRDRGARRHALAATRARSTRRAREEYEAAFNRAVQKRWPPLGLEIENR